ncbi:peptidyl-prolyl cis-trans isomerase CYP95 [Drosophila hydei]|uniref:Peptidyl-prolyl cis-trans isomerase CYP95 n=1 Tax=Drosophila hydei TaxID=7224 RepID=A0A6J2SZ92_DROHY|nr:peptidyl-prolyl cis-trans isomerase CYP95 [Drosophila hydei]XP_030081465.1 peptidyl-prolyl cis-trans isomerase CYP95 [Drosophila hydei]
MSFFRNIRSTLASSRKSSSRDTTPVRSCSSRPASVISSRRDSTTSSGLQRGDTFILNGSDEEEQQQRGNESNSSTLEKKSKKSKVFSKFSTFTKRKKQPSPEELASYEHHPSDTATNTYYKWRNDGDRMLDYDAHADPFNFLYEQQGKGKQAATSADAAASGMQRQPSLGSSSSGSFDSSTYRKSKTPTHLREQLEQLKTHSNDDLLEEEERDKYKTVTLNSFRKSFRDRLLQQQQQQPHNPAWFVEVPPPAAAPQASSQRSASKENRPDFLVFDNDNYRPQSRSPLRDRPSRSATRSPVKRNETFRVAQPMLRRMSPSPTPPSSAIRIEIKNSILPHSPGRLVPVGVAKPMPTTEYYAQRLLASSLARQTPPASKWRQQSQQQQQQQPQQQSPQQRSGRYQTLVHIGSEQGKLSPAPARGRAPTRVQLYGSKPSSRQPPTPTYFGGHYNAPVPVSVRPLSSSRQSSGGVGGNWGRREQQYQQQSSPQPMPRVAPARQRNRSPIKIPWR